MLEHATAADAQPARRLTGLLSLALLSALHPIPAAAQSIVSSTRYAGAVQSGKVAPIATVVGRATAADLSCDGPFDRSWSVIAQGVDDTPQYGSVTTGAAAAFRLLRDDTALYFLARIVDRSIVPREPYYEGDDVQLYLDLRPASGAGSLLGAPAFTRGVFQIMIAAPSAQAGPAHWMMPANVQQSSPIGPIDVTEKLLADGYTVTVRLPYSSLGIGRDRLSAPVGFDLFVDDVDAVPGTDKTTPRTEYSWSGSDDTWEDASLMRFADTNAPASPEQGPLRVMPGRFLSRTGGRSVSGGIIAPLHSPIADFDVTVTAAKPGAGPEVAAARTVRTEFPELGVVVLRRVLELSAITAGSYLIRTQCPSIPHAQTSVRFESLSWRAAGPRPISAFERRRLPDQPLTAGAVTLPNGWRVTPAGRAIALPGDMPHRLIVSPDGRYLLVNTGGYHDHSLSVIDLAAQRVSQSTDVTRTWAGMCLTPSGDLYLSGGGTRAMTAGSGRAKLFRNALHRFVWKNGAAVRRTDLDLPAGNDPSAYIGGIASGRDGVVYVVNTNTDSILRVSPTSDRVVASARVGYRPLSCAVSPDGRQLAVTNWGEKSVSLLDRTTLAEQQRVAVGSHPADLAYSSDGRLFVANAGSNSVSVIGGSQVEETIKTSLRPDDPVGSTPVALAVAHDRLYVANADNNDVAVVDIGKSGASRVIGFIPTGWYPCALAVSPDGRRLYVGTGKGLTFTNSETGRYIGDLLQGHVSIVDLPDDAGLAAYSRQVAENVPVPARSIARSAVTAKEMAGKIRHVVYIIRENRTYDQVFGDMRQGNGDPAITMFGREVTPNAHALAKQYVLFDNLYCNGEVSEDGHQWCDAAYATDFTEKAWPNSYSDRGEPDADDRLTASPAGYLWDNCARSGLTYYSYGEFSDFKSSPNSPPIFTGSKGLEAHASIAWYQHYSWREHDTRRADIFLADLHAAEKTGVWPSFMVMSLGEDHTEGTAPGRYTPVAHVAANDQALGRIVEGVSHSRFWPETAIFVIEDDAQDGADHVDAHRTVGLVLSPYVRRGKVDSTLYTTASLVRTMELLLGLPPMTQFDTYATPLWNAFMQQPLAIAYDDVPPLVNVEARNTPDAPSALLSARLDFSAPDRVEPAVLNSILWRALKPGVPEPAPVRSSALALAR